MQSQVRESRPSVSQRFVLVSHLEPSSEALRCFASLWHFGAIAAVRGKGYQAQPQNRLSWADSHFSQGPVLLSVWASTPVYELAPSVVQTPPSSLRPQKSAQVSWAALLIVAGLPGVSAGAWQVP